MFIVAHDMSLINELKAQLSNEFEKKDLGVAKKFSAWRFTGTFSHKN